MTMHFGVISLFKQALTSLDLGITGRAQEQGLININYYDPRDWAKGSYKQVDDTPYGGGPGMVMMYEPLAKAIAHAKQHMSANAKVVYLSPQGTKLCQNDFNKNAQDLTPLIFIAGRYEGIDERIIEKYVDEEWSIGDFVISGGELAIAVCIDAITRLLPGCLGNTSSAQQDSFMHGLLDCPHYTKPAFIDDIAVPKVLLSGDHKAISRWRRKQALGRTFCRRPELINKYDLDEQDGQLLEEFLREEH